MKASILHNEIMEQPQVVRRLIGEEGSHVAQIAQELGGKFDYMLIAARGTSDNAARYAQYLFGVYNHLPVALATPSLFTLYHEPPRLGKALVVAISQSGQSPDIVEVVAEAGRQGRPTIAITNDPHSPLAAQAAHVIPLQTGPERAVAATKTYTASLAALALFSTMLKSDEPRLNQLDQMPGFMEQTLSGLDEALARVERYRYMDHCTVIGRGFNYSTAFETALKIKELTRTVAEPYSSADFRHGPIAMVRDGFPVIVVAPSGAVAADVSDLVFDLKQRGGELLLISDDRALLELAHLALPIPTGLPEWLTPLVAVLPGQLFALALTWAKGYDPDRPAGITKVTETL